MKGTPLSRAYFDSVGIPFRANATDIETGRMVVIDGVSVNAAVGARMSAPGVFAPVSGTVACWSTAARCAISAPASHAGLALFGMEIEGCARCGGKLKILASLEEPEVIAKNLAHLERAGADQSQAELPRGARAPPSQASLLRIRE